MQTNEEIFDDIPLANDVFRALADPTRRAIFERLTHGETTVSDLTSNADVSQSAVSQHLTVLRRAHLVSERHAGRNSYYRAVPEGLAPLIDWVEHYRAFWLEHFERLKTLLKEMDE